MIVKNAVRAFVQLFPVPHWYGLCRVCVDQSVFSRKREPIEKRGMGGMGGIGEGKKKEWGRGRKGGERGDLLPGLAYVALEATVCSLQAGDPGKLVVSFSPEAWEPGAGVWVWVWVGKPNPGEPGDPGLLMSEGRRWVSQLRPGGGGSLGPSPFCPVTGHPQWEGRCPASLVRVVFIQPADADAHVFRDTLTSIPGSNVLLPVCHYLLAQSGWHEKLLVRMFMQYNCWAVGSSKAYYIYKIIAVS